MAARPGRPLIWAGLLVILGLSYLIYSPAVHNDFTYDDAAYAKVETELHGVNVMLRDYPNLSLWDYFSRPMGYGMSTQGRGLRPITVLSYAVTHHLFRQPKSDTTYPYTDDPRPHHILNLWLHVLCTWLVYLLVARICGPGTPALLATAVFGLTSLHSDPVVSIVGRGELFGFAFGAGSTLLYAMAMDRLGWARVWRLLVAGLLLFLAVCSKESALAWAVFPIVYVLAQRLRSDPATGVGSELLRQGPHAAWSLGTVLVVWGVLWTLLQVNHGGDAFDVLHQANPLYRLGFVPRLPSAVMVLGYGFLKLFWPFFLVSDYGGPVFGLPESFLGLRFLLALVVLSGVLVGGLLAARRWPLLFLAMAAFFGFTFITSNIVVPIETVFGERLLYTAVLGQSFLVAWVAHAVGPRRILAVLLGLGLAAWLAACFWAGHARTYEWKNNETLFITDAEKQPLSSGMNMNAARVYRLKKDWTKWRHHIDVAKEHDPGNAIPYNELGVTFSSRKQFQEAEQYLNMALAAEHFEPERDGPSIYMNLATVMVATDRLQQAKDCWRKVLEIDKSFWMARGQLLMVAYQEDDEAVATRLLQERDPGVGHPDHALYDMHRGMWAHKRGNYAAAVLLLRPAMRELMTRGVVDRIPWVALVESLARTGAIGEARHVIKLLLGQGLEPEFANFLRRLQRELPR